MEAKKWRPKRQPHGARERETETKEKERELCVTNEHSCILLTNPLTTQKTLMRLSALEVPRHVSDTQLQTNNTADENTHNHTHTPILTHTNTFQ